MQVLVFVVIVLIVVSWLQLSLIPYALSLMPSAYPLLSFVFPAESVIFYQIFASFIR